MISTWLLAAIIVLLFAMLAAVGMLLHKVIRIHKMQFEIGQNVSVAGKEASNIYGQMESFYWLIRLLDLPAALPPLRGWAGSPDFLLTIARHALDAKPRLVVECSSGSSTVVLARCMQLNGVGRVVSFENSAEYAAKTRAMLKQQGLEDWAVVLDAPLVVQPARENSRWYSLEHATVITEPIEMLVVDGPPFDTGALARYPAIPTLFSKLSPRCVTFLDDANRADERAVVARWLEEFPQLSVDWLDCEKGCARVSAK